ncbi:uncharacterized protein LOC119685754 [Teleopsis dalmanni]|uniref:uncharacterized protein LOC119685754 n=1 Tax=Teleopsis dalmanni TaxID=139649 RepID=UPI0018CF7268|nr:uncharacterized protein LOC119685754 [Teleopsis dalmanni]
MSLRNDDIEKDDDYNTINKNPQQLDNNDAPTTTVCVTNKEPHMESRLLRSISESSEAKTFISEKDFESKTPSQMLVQRMLGPSHTVSNVYVINDSHVILKVLPEMSGISEQQSTLEPNEANESQERFIHIRKLSDSALKPVLIKKSGTCYLCKQDKVQLKTLQLKTTKSMDSFMISQKTCKVIDKPFPKLSKVVDSSLKDDNNTSLETINSENSNTHFASVKGDVCKIKNGKYKYNASLANKTFNNRKRKTYILNKKRLSTKFKKSYNAFIQTTSRSDTNENDAVLAKHLDILSDTSNKLKDEKFPCIANTSSISELQVAKNKIQTPNNDSHKSKTAKMKLVETVIHSNNTLKKEIPINDRDVRMSSESNESEFVDYKKYKCTNKLQKTVPVDKLKSSSSKIDISNRWIKRHINSSPEEQIYTPIKFCATQKVQEAGSPYNQKDQNNTLDLVTQITSNSDETENVIIPGSKTIKDRCLEWEKKFAVINSSLSKNYRTVPLNINTCSDYSTIPVQKVDSSKSKICKPKSELICCSLQQENKNYIYPKNHSSSIVTEADKSLQEHTETNSRTTQYLSSAYIEFRPNPQTNRRPVIKQEKYTTGRDTEVISPVTRNKHHIESKKKLGNINIDAKKNIEGIYSELDERSNFSKTTTDKDTFNDKVTRLQNLFLRNEQTPTKYVANESIKAAKRCVNTDVSSPANITYSSAIYNTNSDLKTPTQQRDTFDLSPKHLKMSPKIRARCLEWEERIRLANSSVTNGIQTDECIKGTYSNSEHYKADSDTNCNKLIRKLEYINANVLNVEETKLHRAVYSGNVVQAKPKANESLKSYHRPKYSQDINSSGMKSSNYKNDIIAQVRSEHRTNETEDCNNGNNTEVCFVPSPVTKSSLNFLWSKKHEPTFTSHLKSTIEYPRISAKRTGSYINEDVKVGNTKKITSTAFKEFSTRSARVNHSSRVSIFQCFRNLFQKRPKRHYKKIHAVINKTYFISWIHQETERGTDCKYCCEKKSTIERSQSTYF